MYIARLASNEIVSPSNKIHPVVGRAKDLSAPLYVPHLVLNSKVHTVLTRVCPKPTVSSTHLYSFFI